MGFAAKEMMARPMEQFEATEFEFFDFKALDAAIEADKQGKVKEEAHAAALREIETATNKGAFCPSAQVLDWMRRW